MAQLEGCLSTMLSHEFMLVKVQHHIKSGMVEMPTTSAQAQWRQGRRCSDSRQP